MKDKCEICGIETKDGLCNKVDHAHTVAALMQLGIPEIDAEMLATPSEF